MLKFTETAYILLSELVRKYYNDSIDECLVNDDFQLAKEIKQELKDTLEELELFKP